MLDVTLQFLRSRGILFAMLFAKTKPTEGMGCHKPPPMDDVPSMRAIAWLFPLSLISTGVVFMSPRDQASPGALRTTSSSVEGSSTKIPTTANERPTSAPAASAEHASADAETPARRAISRARLEVARGVRYDPSYVPLSYPAGDVAQDHGVCTDVVVRAYRAAGVDLQVKVHEDVVRDKDAYGAFVKAPDANIDHRRVGPLKTWFERHAKRVSLEDVTTYQPGDVVVWSFSCKAASPGCYPHHIGVVSDKQGARGLPLVIHNLGPSPSEDDMLDAWTRIGHFRLL